MPQFICIVTHCVHGYSGNEIPPPIVKRNQYIECSHDGETEQEFRDRMRDTCLPIRRALDNRPAKPYSYKDGLDWLVLPVTALDRQKILEN